MADMRRWLFLALVPLCGAADAKAPEDTTLRRDLERARADLRGQRIADALRAFAALAERAPGDFHIHSDYALAAVKGNDAATAIEHAGVALAAARGADQRAAALYNLGRGFELCETAKAPIPACSKLDGSYAAASFHCLSYRNRPNEAVGKRVAAIDPDLWRSCLERVKAISATAPPRRLELMARPKPRKGCRVVESHRDDAGGRCRIPRRWNAPSQETDLHGAALVVTAGASSKAAAAGCGDSWYLVVSKGKHEYELPLGVTCEGKRHDHGFELEGMRIDRLPDGRPLLHVVVVETSWDEVVFGEPHTAQTRDQVLCLLGDGPPACILRPLGRRLIESSARSEAWGYAPLHRWFGDHVPSDVVLFESNGRPAPGPDPRSDARVFEALLGSRR